MKYHYLIVGAGIAGTLLARALAKRGQKVCVVFDPAHVGASGVAAWMINPITGIRFVPSWRVDTFLPYAIAFYRELEVESGLKIWNPRIIHRLFQGEDEIPRWEKKRSLTSVQKYLADEFGEAVDISHLHHTLGGIKIQGGGWVNLQPWLDYSRRKSFPGVVFVEQKMTDEASLISNFSDQKVIFCTGFGAHPLPWKPAKGELLTVSIPGFHLRDILLRGIFVIPLGHDLYRVGATYEWEDLTRDSTEKGISYLSAKLAALVTIPFQIIDSQAGIRPILRDARPIVGMLSEHSQFGIFNGLGSKAALVAPWIAEHYAEHLVKGCPLDPEIDSARVQT